jgi:hypothetical protein
MANGTKNKSRNQLEYRYLDVRPACRQAGVRSGIISFFKNSKSYLTATNLAEVPASEVSSLTGWLF